MFFTLVQVKRKKPLHQSSTTLLLEQGHPQPLALDYGQVALSIPEEATDSWDLAFHVVTKQNSRHDSTASSEIKDRNLRASVSHKIFLFSLAFI